MSPGKKTELEVARLTMPTALRARGVSESEWSTVCDKLGEFSQAQFFYHCPFLECVYYCCPGGPVQTLLCMLNPVSCIVCFMPDEKRKEQTVLAIAQVIGRHGLECKLKSGTSGWCAEFVSL